MVLSFTVVCCRFWHNYKIFINKSSFNVYEKTKKMLEKCDISLYTYSTVSL